MNVLFWMSSSFDRQSPSEHLLTAVIEDLCKQGHSVHILQKDTGGPMPMLPMALSSLDVSCTCIPFRLQKKSNFIARYLADVWYILASQRHIRQKDQYGAVFLQSNNVAGFAVALLRMKLKRTPITYNVQDIFPYNAMYSGLLKKNSFFFNLLAAIQRYAYKKSDHLITVSEDMEALLIEDGIPAEKVECIYNWSYQDTPYTPETVDCEKARTMFPETHFNVVYAGNIGAVQNVEILLQAANLMKQDPSVRFHIIGDGLHKAKLETLARSLELNNVVFWPMQPKELAPSIYLTADINVIPLAENIYRTALPSKTATCLACGKPIVFCLGNDSVFCKKLLSQPGIHLIDSNDAVGLADAINTQKTNFKKKSLSYNLSPFSKTTNCHKYASTILTYR